MSTLLHKPQATTGTDAAAGATSRTPRRTLRLGGLAGLGFAAGLFLQNAILLSGAPLPSASPEEIAAFYTDHAWRVGLATAWVSVNLPLVLLFVHVAATRLAEHPDGILWGRMARSAVVLIAALFGVTTLLQVTLLTTMPQLSADPGLLALAWNLHSAAFALGGAALGILLGSLSLGARHVPLVPRWMVPVGLVGSALLIAGSVGIVNVVQGGLMLWSIMSGFGAWVLFLVVAGVGMVRSRA